MLCQIISSEVLDTEIKICLHSDLFLKKFQGVTFFLFFLKVYLHALVRNLFNEGNDVYRERDWNHSISQYSEALSIADYAKSEEILIPKEIIEKLYINRIACYSNMVSCDL